MNVLVVLANFQIYFRKLQNLCVFAFFALKRTTKKESMPPQRQLLVRASLVAVVASVSAIEGPAVLSITSAAVLEMGCCWGPSKGDDGKANDGAAL